MLLQFILQERGSILSFKNAASITFRTLMILIWIFIWFWFFLPKLRLTLKPRKVKCALVNTTRMGNPNQGLHLFLLTPH